MDCPFSLDDLEVMEYSLPKEGERPALLKQLADTMRENEQLLKLVNFYANSSGYEYETDMGNQAKTFLKQRSKL